MRRQQCWCRHRRAEVRDTIRRYRGDALLTNNADDDAFNNLLYDQHYYFFFVKIRGGTKKQLRLFHICFVIGNFVVVAGVFLLENLLEHWLCGCPVQAFVIQALLLALCALVIINAIS